MLKLKLNILFISVLEIAIVLVFCATSTVAEDEDSPFAPRLINCYIGPWVNDNRKPEEAFRPEMINASACTHVSYSFFGFDDQGNFDSSTTSLEWMKQGSLLKASNRNLKIIAVVGGPVRSSQQFSKVMANERFRRNLVETCTLFVRSKRIDGIDIHWIYPGSDGQHDDKENFVIFLRELKARLKSHEVGISVPGNVDIDRSGYDVREIVKYVDFINVMAFNYTLSYEFPYHAPLLVINRLIASELSVEVSIYNWHSNGVPYNIMNLGVAFMGHEYIRPEGYDIITYKSYMDLCQLYGHEPHINVHGGIIFVKIPYGIVSYETTSTLGMKLNLVNQRCMRGVTIWSLGYDDYLGKCGRKFPLMELVVKKVGGNVTALKS
ncbi:chitinase-3-like protein 2 isoform X2 [Haematobia irritans]|uniref:chitinase-3-like protein 2 isoform X2 n=1 Tax=Haematobia irritans TaxID=7368 RepID=UPI003F509EB9